MGGMVRASWLTGTLTGSSCGVVLEGIQYWNKGSRQQYISSLDGTEWVAGGKGTVPTYAIPTGFTNLPGKSIQTAYTCRAKFTGDQGGTVGRPVTGIGWTVDGATCNYVYYGAKTATTFEVLSRQPDKSYNLRLDDFWPVPKKGVWYPGLPHVLAVTKKVVHAAEHEARKLIRHIHIRHHHWRF